MLRGEDLYLFPYKDFADIRINSIHLCEPCLFKDTAIKLLENSDIDEEYQSDAKRLLNSLKKFQSLDLELIPKDSLLREFVG